MPKTKTVKYIDLISQDAKQINKEEKQFVNDDAKLHVEGAILETKKTLAQAKKTLADSQKAEPYNLQVEIDATIKVSDLEQALKMSTDIFETRF